MAYQLHLTIGAVLGILNKYIQCVGYIAEMSRSSQCMGIGTEEHPPPIISDLKNSHKEPDKKHSCSISSIFGPPLVFSCIYFQGTTPP